MARFLSVKPDAEVCIGDRFRVSEAVQRSLRAFARYIMPAIAAL